MIKKISYLGLGTMGSGMASNLLKAGYELTVWNRSVERNKPFARNGARVADSPANAVRDVDLVMYSLSNDQAVEEVVFGSNGILSGINAGQIAIDMSTVLPATSLREQEAYSKRGADFLDQGGACRFGGHTWQYRAGGVSYLACDRAVRGNLRERRLRRDEDKTNDRDQPTDM